MRASGARGFRAAGSSARVAHLLGIGLICGIIGCSEHHALAPDEERGTLPAGMLVSNALVAPHNSTSSSLEVSHAVAATSLTYVSAKPGTFTAGEVATLKNKTRGSSAKSVQIIDGGFDPIGIAAEADDELTLTISTADYKPIAVSNMKVPPRRPPEVVRTKPPKGRTDVALNVQIEIIFSEPVDKATVSAGISLTQGGKPVAGDVELSDGGLRALFVPDTPLEPDASYLLTVATSIRDLDGDALENPDNVEFTTGPAPAALKPGDVIVSATTHGDRLDPDGYAVSFDSLPSTRSIDANGAMPPVSLVEGWHTVSISGISDNCREANDGARRVRLIPGQAVSVTFDVLCTAQPLLEGMIAFVSDRDGNPEIYTANADGTGVVRLTYNTARDIDPAWSPDGKRIAFVSDRDGAAHIYVMDADGSNVVRMTNEDRASSPSWSPDGRRIAYSGLVNEQVGMFVIEQFRIFVIDAGSPGSVPTHIGFDRGYNDHPAWSPDGKQIAFVSDWRAYDGLYDIYVMNADGSSTPKLIIWGPFFTVEGQQFYFQPAWSRDGKKIAVASFSNVLNNQPHSDIEVANADGSNLVPIASSQGYSHPAWSADGSVILYSDRSCPGCSGSSIYYARTDRTNGTGGGFVMRDAYSPAWRP